MFFNNNFPRLKVKTSLIVLPLALSSLFIGATLANAADDIFLKLEGIKGESVDKQFSNEINVLDWTWGMTQSGTTHMGSGGGAGKVAVQDLSFTHYVDAATPELMKFCAMGKHVPEAILTVRKAGEQPVSYIVISLKDVIVSSVAISGDASTDRVTEAVSLNFGSFKFSYQPQDAKGAKAGGTIDSMWNIAENVAKY